MFRLSTAITPHTLWDSRVIFATFAQRCLAKAIVLQRARDDCVSNREEQHMYARLTTVQGKPEKIEDAIRVIENDVIPGSKVLPGFKNGYWLADRKSGKLLGLTVFETEKDIEESEAAASKLRKSAAEKLGAEVKNVERFELIART